MRVVMYGVRGSCPCSGDRYRRVGGNTSCVLISVDGEPPLVLDLGTGLRALGVVLGEQARKEGRPVRANALLTHLHFDHIIGLPFFAPLHEPGSSLTVFGPTQDQSTLADTIAEAVKPPFFPLHMAEFKGEIELCEVREDDDMAFGGISVRGRSVPHLGHTLGYRVEAEGHTLVYIPDHQAPLDRWTVTDEVRLLCEGADVLLHDAQYNDDEFVQKTDWGHSTVAYAVRVAAESGVRRLVLFHHDPAHSDRAIAELLHSARRLPEAQRLESVDVATEGMVIDL